MQKMQILFPDPQMARLRELARLEDRPVSEIVRRAVERDLDQRGVRLQARSAPGTRFPTFDGGRVRVPANRMKAILHDPEA